MRPRGGSTRRCIHSRAYGGKVKMHRAGPGHRSVERAISSGMGRMGAGMQRLAGILRDQGCRSEGELRCASRADEGNLRRDWALLEEKELRLQQGMIVGVTIIAAPSYTQNQRTSLHLDTCHSVFGPCSVCGGRRWARLEALTMPARCSGSPLFIVRPFSRSGCRRLHVEAGKLKVAGSKGE